jgi:hypothetical protein
VLSVDVDRFLAVVRLAVPAKVLKVERSAARIQGDLVVNFYRPTT